MARRNETWLALSRSMEKRVTGSRPPTDFQFFSVATRQLVIRLGGEAIASVTVEPAALETLMAHPKPGEFLAVAPAPAHLLVEQVGGQVRWRQLGAPPAAAQ